MVAQLVEWSLATPEVRGLNPIIDINDQYSANCKIEKTKLKEKRVGNGPPLKKYLCKRGRDLMDRGPT